MEKKKRILMAGILGVAAVITAVYVFSQAGSKRITEIDGTFEAGNGQEGENGVLLQMIFNQGTMTYEEKLNGTATIDSGSYSMAEGKLQVFSEASDENTKTYLIDGDAVIAENSFYQGDIPKSGAFDAVCTLSDQGKNSEITFKSDGTYVQKDTLADAAEVKTAAGSYKREGDVIKRSAQTKEPVVDLYVYQGQVTGEYFIKAQ